MQAGGLIIGCVGRKIRIGAKLDDGGLHCRRASRREEA